MKPVAGNEPPRADNTRPVDFPTSAERDAYITAHADYFTVGRRIGPREGYDRHEVKTLDEAKTLARRMADQTRKVYMIYAVAGISDCFVTAIQPE